MTEKICKYIGKKRIDTITKCDGKTKTETTFKDDVIEFENFDELMCKMASILSDAGIKRFKRVATYDKETKTFKVEMVPTQKE